MAKANQMSLDFDASLVERHKTCLDCVRQAAYTYRNPLKTIAADMDLSESKLSRKLAQNPNDTRHFNLEDLERFIVATGDTTPILYLVGKYLADQVVTQAGSDAAPDARIAGCSGINQDGNERRCMIMSYEADVANARTSRDKYGLA